MTESKTEMEVLLEEQAKTMREREFNRRIVWFLEKWKPSDSAVEQEYSYREEFAGDLASVLRECWVDAYTTASENYVVQLRKMAETMGTVKALLPNG